MLTEVINNAKEAVLSVLSVVATPFITLWRFIQPVWNTVCAFFNSVAAAIDSFHNATVENVEVLESISSWLFWISIALTVLSFLVIKWIEFEELGVVSRILAAVGLIGLGLIVAVEVLPSLGVVIPNYIYNIFMVVYSVIAALIIMLAGAFCISCITICFSKKRTGISVDIFGVIEMIIPISYLVSALLCGYKAYLLYLEINYGLHINILPFLN